MNYCKLSSPTFVIICCHVTLEKSTFIGVKVDRIYQRIYQESIKEFLGKKAFVIKIFVICLFWLIIVRSDVKLVNYKLHYIETVGQNVWNHFYMNILFFTDIMESTFIPYLRIKRWHSQLLDFHTPGFSLFSLLSGACFKHCNLSKQMFTITMAKQYICCPLW